MSSTFKSQTLWRDTLEKPQAPKLVKVPPKMVARFGKGKMLIPTPMLVDGLVKNRNYLASDVQKKQDLDAFRALCAKMAKKVGKVDWVKAIHEARNEREDQLLGRTPVHD